jgi:uncharacterized damage-inducible protein DinB
LVLDIVHHRGQFSVYLRMAGGKVPSIYGPTADEPWPLSQEPEAAARRPPTKKEVPAEMFRADLELFRSTRARTLTMVRGLSQGQMDYTPAPEKWSIGAVLDHLLLSEEFFRSEIAQLIQLKKAGRQPVRTRTIADLNFSVAFIPKVVLPLFEGPLTVLNVFVPSSVREFIIRNRLVPAQSADIATPRNGRPAAELRDELESFLKQTAALLEANSSLDYGEMIEQHPLLGTNNVLQLLRLLAFHEQRHQSQISEILSDPKFPHGKPACDSPGSFAGRRWLKE